MGGPGGMAPGLRRGHAPAGHRHAPVSPGSQGQAAVKGHAPGVISGTAALDAVRLLAVHSYSVPDYQSLIIL